MLHLNNRCRSLKTAFDAIATTTLKDIINDLVSFVKSAPQLLRDLAERLHQAVRKIWTYDGCVTCNSLFASARLST